MSALGNESAPLFGRFNAGNFKLEPLRYDDVVSFYDSSKKYGITEKLIMYGVLGGTPRYHALVDINVPYKDEIVTLLMQPHAILENEIRFLLGSEQIRDPSVYNSILGVIARGATKTAEIQNLVGIDRGTLSFYLRTLLALGWILREIPFGDTSERRALYRIADPFVTFWYRFIRPSASELQFTNPHDVYESRVRPYLSDYMGSCVFETICFQWMQRYGKDLLGLNITQMGRYWNRTGNNEIDMVARLDPGNMLYGECKWRASSNVTLNDYIDLRTKVSRLPDKNWAIDPVYILFSVGGFSPDLEDFAKENETRLYLVKGTNLIPDSPKAER